MYKNKDTQLAAELAEGGATISDTDSSVEYTMIRAAFANAMRVVFPHVLPPPDDVQSSEGKGKKRARGAAHVQKVEDVGTRWENGYRSSARLHE